MCKGGGLAVAVLSRRTIDKEAVVADDVFMSIWTDSGGERFYGGECVGCPCSRGGIKRRSRLEKLDKGKITSI